MTLLRPKTGVRIRATGSYLPERVVTSTQLANRPGAPLSEAEIAKLTGIEERHWVEDGQATSDLAVAAGGNALRAAELEKVDRLLLSTTSPDHPSPATACTVQHQLGLAPAAAVDLSAACAGFLFALDWGARAVLTGDETVLVIAADVRSRYLDLDDKATFSLFGDGSGAAILEPGPAGEGLLGLYLAADGAGYDTIMIPAGGSRKPASASTIDNREHFLHMTDGPKVFLHAIEGMSDAAEHLLEQLGVAMDDVDLIIPHQPNKMILTRLARYMRIPQEKIFINVERTGNMSSASLAVAFDQALSTGAAKPGDLVMLLGGGAGFCVGAALVRLTG